MLCHTLGMDEFGDFYTLGVALALGLLIGLERGWQERDLAEGERVAGVRTSALIGLLGGVFGLLAQDLGGAFLALGFAALAGVLVAGHVVGQQRVADLGITTLIAGLLAFSFGAMATQGHVVLATAAAVVTTIILSIKPVLHRLLERLERRELYATLKMLLISVVVLPLLPDQGFGPWEALNPYRIWWMVVLIAGISYLGYFAMKLVGQHKGILATGLLAGLASSTAVTVNLSRLARRQNAALDVLAAGVLAAGATMFPRVLVITGVVQASLAFSLLWPMVVMSVVCYAAAWFLWRRGSAQVSDHGSIGNPFELRPALIFAGVLAALMLLSRALADTFGDAGVYALAAASGLADVDAITLSLANMAGGAIDAGTATLAILIAAFVNTLVKVAFALGIGGRQFGARVGAAATLVVSSGLATWWFVG
jgi:uncharacterized membrane protein (DUF4010 family)